MLDDRTFRWPFGYRIGVAVVVVILCVLVLVLAALFVIATRDAGALVQAIVLLNLVVVLVLLLYVLRDARGKWGWCVTVDPPRIALRLPAGRSAVHRLAQETREFPLSDIVAIVTRRELFPSLAMANLQQVYALKLVTGEYLVLGEDRALGTTLKSDVMHRLIDRLREMTLLDIVDLGMVEGGGGLLGAWFTRVPGWDAECLDAKGQARAWRRVRRTGYLAVLGALVVVVLPFILA